MPIKLLSNFRFDEIVKSRHSRENGNPGVVPAKAGNQYLEKLDSPHRVRGRPAGVYPDENRGRNDELECYSG
jgi:hypothetical protein